VEYHSPQIKGTMEDNETTQLRVISNRLGDFHCHNCENLLHKRYSCSNCCRSQVSGSD